MSVIGETAARRAKGGVLIVGGGWSGSMVARGLGRRGATIVSPQNFVLFTPLLPEAASGTLEPRHVLVPLRRVCPDAELVLGAVRSADLAAKTVAVDTVESRLEVHYEELVVAVGSVPRVHPIEGLAEHAVGFKDLADAVHLRNHVLREIEAADAESDPARRRRHLTFVFVGGGYAGVEGLAELADLAADACRFYPRLSAADQRWVLVDAAPRILPEIPTRLGEYAAQELSRRGIELRVGTTLERVESDAVVLSDGERIETHTCVWTAGVAPHPLTAELGLPLDERGRIVVDSTLRVEGLADVWALGDCARVPNRATPGRFDPPTSQHALRQARRLARNLVGEPKPYAYRALGQVATLGQYKGIADLLGLRLSGFAGWFATRTYHLYQLPLPSRKLRVVLDWTIALFFRRDIVELGTLGHPSRLDAPGDPAREPREPPLARRSP
jgi:NADH dehydrogenase